jgi:hypothetical protein
MSSRFSNVRCTATTGGRATAPARTPFGHTGSVFDWGSDERVWLDEDKEEEMLTCCRRISRWPAPAGANPDGRRRSGEFFGGRPHYNELSQLLPADEPMAVAI